MNIPPQVMVKVDGPTLIERLKVLGDAGRGEDGQLSRLAASDADKAARDLVVSWMKQAELDVSTDGIGNIFGTWPSGSDAKPVMIGSHIDSVINAGIYDGCYGVLAGLSVVEAIQQAKLELARPISVAVFTNEEGVRYAPDMMGSLVCAGGLDVHDALATVGIDGSVLGDELRRIGYAGDLAPTSIVPHAFLELHIEQGPVLETEHIQIGAVENLQGISWQRISIEGVANHAGTTPTHLRHDAGLAAARINTFLSDLVSGEDNPAVATVGTLQIFPNAVNVVPNKAVFTVDLRNPIEERLIASEIALAEYCAELEGLNGVSIHSERLVRFEPVAFDTNLVLQIEADADALGYSCKRMTSGAGHDAQMMSRICPSAMIFIPSRDGISHSPKEYSADAELIAGVDVLLRTVCSVL